MKDIRIGALIISLLIPLAVGGVSAALTVKGMASYGTMNKPPLSPPAWLFPIAWTILYLMMGLSSYYIFVSGTSDAKNKVSALALYAVQLIMNFMWSIVFFNFGLYLLAFVWLIAMWCVVILCAYRFWDINRTASLLLVPYILWLTFAAYLNFGSFILNIENK